MNVSLESGLALTFVLGALVVTMCQGQGQRNYCGVGARPHPNGICGPKLSRAHSNLCFLLRQAYPEHFQSSGKRSVQQDNLVNRIYSIPLSVLAEAELTQENWGTFLYKRASSSKRSDVMSGAETELFSRGDQAELSDMNSVTRALFDMLQKRSARQKRSTNAGMVCDCCFNVCTPRQLATYC